VSFSQEPAAIAQFLRQATPNTGPEPFPSAAHRDVLGSTVAELIDQTGCCVLMTHSHSGQYTWVTAIKRPDAVRAIVALETGEFAFPADGVPEEIPTRSEMLRSFMLPQLVRPDDFLKLTRIPILVVFGDNIATEMQDNIEVDLYRIMRARAKQFVETLNERGGDATFVSLPDLGITGNTHFPMSDLTNVEVADVIADFLARKGLDDRTAPHQGPRLVRPAAKGA
jgi:hypothetical protein